MLFILLINRSKVKLEPIDTSFANWKALFEPLPPTSNDSPLPSLSEMSQYFTKKVAESTTTVKVLKTSTPTKLVHSPKIPPSGTPIKFEPDILSSTRSLLFNSSVVKEELGTPSSHTSHELSDWEETCEDDEYIQIAHLKFQKKEFTHIFPAFPKTHVNSYAYIIELDDEILNNKDLLKLRDGLQYSLTGGGGPKVYENVKFFAKEGQKVPMKIHFRQCAGNFSTQRII
jgi:hypothetical protein